MKNSSMKKVLGMGLLLISGLANASDIITNDMIVGAFTADLGVQEQTRAVRQQLRQALPNCAMNVDPDLHGHLFATGINTHAYGPYRRKHYLVSRLIACSTSDNGGVIGIRRAVTAKVAVNVRNDGHGSLEEIPFKVTLVDINNSDSFEIH